MPEAPEDDDPWAALEAEAEELLEGLPDDPEVASKPLIDKLRKQLAGRAKQEQAAEERGYQRAVAELKARAEREQVLAKHGVPAPLRKLLDDVDATDDEAVSARIQELRAAGVTWKGPAAPSPTSAGEQPETEQAAPPDPAQVVSAFQQAQAGGVPADNGGLLGRVARDGLGAIRSAQDAQGFESELNQQVAALGQPRSAGIIG